MSISLIYTFIYSLTYYFSGDEYEDTDISTSALGGSLQDEFLKARMAALKHLRLTKCSAWHSWVGRLNLDIYSQLTSIALVSVALPQASNTAMVNYREFLSSASRVKSLEFTMHRTQNDVAIIESFISALSNQNNHFTALTIGFNHAWAAPSTEFVNYIPLIRWLESTQSLNYFSFRSFSIQNAPLMEMLDALADIKTLQRLHLLPGLVDGPMLSLKSLVSQTELKELGIRLSSSASITQKVLEELSKKSGESLEYLSLVGEVDGITENNYIDPLYNTVGKIIEADRNRLRTLILDVSQGPSWMNSLGLNKSKLMKDLSNPNCKLDFFSITAHTRAHFLLVHEFTLLLQNPWFKVPRVEIFESVNDEVNSIQAYCSGKFGSVSLELEVSDLHRFKGLEYHCNIIQEN